MNDPSSRPKGVTPLGILAALIGVALFAYAIRQAGIDEIIVGVRRLGWGFAAVLALSAVRDAVRTVAWQAAVEGDRPLGFVDGWAGRVTGEALGNLTPFGLLVSEPAKAAYVRHRVPLAAGFAGTVVENLFYSLSVVVVVGLGLVVLLVGFPVPPPLRVVSLIALATFVGVGAGLAWMIAARPLVVTGTVNRLKRVGLAPATLARWATGLVDLEAQVVGFAARHPRRTLRMAAMDGLFHVAAVAEVYLVLALIAQDAPPTLLTAFILETVNRIVTVAFKFVPLRLGVDEAASGFVSNVLQLGTATGVTLAIVRKARVLAWSAVGVVLMAHRSRNDHGTLTK